MALSSVAELVQELAQGALLSAPQRQELARLQATFTEVRGLARELVQRGWLTPYQVNQLVQGRGRDLVLGPYVLLERLGEGGMGQVFKAQHTFLNRPVALKLISQAHLGAGAAAERFLLEMRLVAQLDHPHIVRALDAGQAGERYFLAMELITGATLARLVQQSGPLPVGQACACIRQAALGLQHAAERGLVHRDIKPSNLMLSTPPDGLPVVKVLDLGLARAQGGESSRDLTRTGTLMGTLDYLAPEQALDPRAVDVRADLYSLGCTFFFLLAGRPPFQGGTEAQRLLQHQQQEPPAIETLRTDVPPAVAATLRRLLAKRPELRFQTATEVAAALQPFASWEGRTTMVAEAPEGGARATSLIEQRPGASERGWTLMVEPTRARGPGSTSPGLPQPVPGQATGAGSSFGLPLPASVLTAAPEAPSLVAARAAPETGWTLLAEPVPDDVAATAVVSPEALSPAEAPGERPRKRLPVGLIVGVMVGLVLLALGGAGLAWLLRSSTPAEVPVVDGGGKHGGNNKPPRPEVKKPAVKQPGPQAVKWGRPLIIKPDQPMNLPRTGDLVFPVYPSGFFAMADRADRDTFNVWDLTTMKAGRSFNAVSGLERPIALSPDGRWLAGKVGNKIRICDAEKGQVATLPLPEGRADWVGFAGTDRLVTIRQKDPGRGLEVWDLKAQKVAFSLPLPAGCAASHAAVSPDGQLLVVPGANQLLLQDLRENAREIVLALPKQRGPFGLSSRGLAFSEDGSELAALFDEPHVGLRVTSWDVKRWTVSADHPVPRDTIAHNGFFYRDGPPLEWLPKRKGWLLFGQALLDFQTGALLGTIPPQNNLRPPVVHVLTGPYGVEVTGPEVRIIRLPQGKGG